VVAVAAAAHGLQCLVVAGTLTGGGWNAHHHPPEETSASDEPLCRDG
jgi:hypothetical protein